MSEKNHVLILDDEKNYLLVLQAMLEDAGYKVTALSDSQTALPFLEESEVDVLITDMKMPHLTGQDILEHVKKNYPHIPVLIMTAFGSIEGAVDAMRCGADDYITKPFNMDLLLLRIQKQLDLWKQLRQKFQKHIEVKPGDIEGSSLDEDLIKKAIAYVEKNMSEPDFSVEDLSRELGMSRVYLYKKLLAITGKTPIEFIRIIRLKRSAQLLQKTDLSVSEVAYRVGFNNPRYFSKYFKEEFGVLPSAFVPNKEDNRDT